MQPPAASRLLLPAILGLAAGLMLSAAPAQADQPCWVQNTMSGAWQQDSTLGTDQGSEHGSNNSTCQSGASAYGVGNNASGTHASAFGFDNQARGVQSSAFGYVNRVS